MNKRITLLAILLISLLLSGCFLKTIWKGKEVLNDYEELEKGGRLVFVTNYSPRDYRVKGDTIEGFNYELIQLLRGYANLEMSIELESGLQNSIEGLNEGRYHVIAQNIPITTELKDKILFTIPIAQDRQVLVQRKSAFNNDQPPIRSHLDLAEKVLYVAKSSPVILRIKNLAKEIASPIHYVEDDVYTGEQLAIMVAKGEIDYAVCGENTAKDIARNHPELDIDTMIGFTQLEGWAVSTNSPILLDSLNTWLQRLKETPQFNRLYKKYYK